MVDTMKVKNGIQIDGMHKIDKGDCDLVDPSSYCDTNERIKILVLLRLRVELNCAVSPS